MSVAGNPAYELAQRAAWQGNHKLALEHYRNALKLEPKRGDIWWSMSLTMINLSMFKEAKEAQKMAAQLDPKIRETHDLNHKLAEIKELGSKGPGSLRALMAYMMDEDSIVGGSARRTLEDDSYRLDTSCVEPLIQALEASKGWLEAVMYSSMLARIGSASLEPLLGMIHHPNENIQLESIKALGKIGDKRAIAHLQPLEEAESERLRQCAASALDVLRGS